MRSRSASAVELRSRNAALRFYIKQQDEKPLHFKLLNETWTDTCRKLQYQKPFSIVIIRSSRFLFSKEFEESELRSTCSGELRKRRASDGNDAVGTAKPVSADSQECGTFQSTWWFRRCVTYLARAQRSRCRTSSSTRRIHGETVWEWEIINTTKLIQQYACQQYQRVLLRNVVRLPTGCYSPTNANWASNQLC